MDRNNNQIRAPSRRGAPPRTHSDDEFEGKPLHPTGRVKIEPSNSFDGDMVSLAHGNVDNNHNNNDNNNHAYPGGNGPHNNTMTFDQFISSHQSVSQGNAPSTEGFTKMSSIATPPEKLSFIQWSLFILALAHAQSHNVVIGAMKLDLLESTYGQLFQAQTPLLQFWAQALSVYLTIACPLSPSSSTYVIATFGDPLHTQVSVQLATDGCHVFINDDFSVIIHCPAGQGEIFQTLLDSQQAPLPYQNGPLAENPQAQSTSLPNRLFFLSKFQGPLGLRIPSSKLSFVYEKKAFIDGSQRFKLMLLDILAPNGVVLVPIKSAYPTKQLGKSFCNSFPFAFFIAQYLQTKHLRKVLTVQPNNPADGGDHDGDQDSDDGSLVSDDEADDDFGSLDLGDGEGDVDFYGEGESEGEGEGEDLNQCQCQCQGDNFDDSWFDSLPPFISSLSLLDGPEEKFFDEEGGSVAETMIKKEFNFDNIASFCHLMIASVALSSKDKKDPEILSQLKYYVITLPYQLMDDIIEYSVKRGRKMCDWYLDKIAKFIPRSIFHQLTGHFHEDCLTGFEPKSVSVVPNNDGSMYAPRMFVLTFPPTSTPFVTLREQGTNPLLFEAFVDLFAAFKGGFEGLADFDLEGESCFSRAGLKKLEEKLEEGLKVLPKLTRTQKLGQFGSFGRSFVPSQARPQEGQQQQQGQQQVYRSFDLKDPSLLDGAVFPVGGRPASAFKRGVYSCKQLDWDRLCLKAYAKSHSDFFSNFGQQQPPGQGQQQPPGHGPQPPPPQYAQSQHAVNVVKNHPPQESVKTLDGSKAFQNTTTITTSTHKKRGG